MTIDFNLVGSIQTATSGASYSMRGAELRGADSAQGLETTSSGDTVSISDQARAFAAKISNKAEEGESEEDSFVKIIKDKIEQLQQEIEELEKSDLPEKEKQNKLQEKRALLMEMQEQLQKAINGGQEYFGGTRAEGFGGSVSSF